MAVLVASNSLSFFLSLPCFHAHARSLDLSLFCSKIHASVRGGSGSDVFVCVNFLLTFGRRGKGERFMTRTKGDEHRTEEYIMKCAIFSNANAKFQAE